MSLRMSSQNQSLLGLQLNLHHIDGLENFKYKIVLEQKSTQVPGSSKSKHSLGNPPLFQASKIFTKTFQRKISTSLKKQTKLT